MSSNGGAFSPGMLRTYVQDGHLSFLFGAGTAASYFSVLGGVEEALTEIEASSAGLAEKEYARASVLGYFYRNVLAKNRGLVDGDPDADTTIENYAAFARVISHILIRRKSTLLEKRVSLFTTNVDLLFERGFDHAQIRLNDGFDGRFTRVLDTSNFGNLTFRTSVRYDQRSEMPTIDLVKLHGSVDWVIGGVDERVECDHRLEALTTLGDRLAVVEADLASFAGPGEVTAGNALKAGQSATDQIRDFLRAFDSLALVLPEKAKFASTLLGRTYYELLRRFANELERENSLLLVHGFSFRDEHLRDLVLRAAGTNPTLQVVTFCYSENAAEEIQKLFPASAVPNGNIAFVVGDELDLAKLTGEWFEVLSGLALDDGAA